MEDTSTQESVPSPLVQPARPVTTATACSGKGKQSSEQINFRKKTTMIESLAAPTGTEKLGATEASKAGKGLSASPDSAIAGTKGMADHSHISANGTDLDCNDVNVMAKFKGVCEAAKAQGTYDGKPFNSPEAQHRMEFDKCKLQGFTPSQQAQAVNAKFGTHYTGVYKG